jgi:hypothetical protein
LTGTRRGGRVGVSRHERVVLSRMERIRRGLSVDDDYKIGRGGSGRCTQVWLARERRQ